MITSDLTRNIKISIKTAIGQLNYIHKQVDNEQEAEKILLQFKAVQAIVNKTIIELLDDTYRKAMAEKISSAHQNCPGNCGNEFKIEKLRKLFPDFTIEEIPHKLKEAQELEQKLMKFLADKNLDTPNPLD